jgi:hypothetical protein
VPPEAQSAAQLERFSALMRDFQRHVEATGAPLLTVDAAIQALSHAIEDTSAPVRRLGDSMRRTAGSVQVVDRRIVEMDRDLRRLRLGSADATSGLQRFQAAFKDYGLLLHLQRNTLDATGESEKEFVERTRELAETLRAVKWPGLYGWADKMSALGGGAGGVGTFAQNTVSVWNAAKGAGPALAQLSRLLSMSKTGVVSLLATVTGGAIAVGQLVARFMEAQGAIQAFGGTLAGSEANVARLTRLFTNNREVMVLHGIEAEELTKTYAALTRSYGLSEGGARQFGLSMMRYSEASTDAILKTMAMGKVTGLTTDQVADLVSSLGVVGENVGQSDLMFAKLALSAERAGINVADMVTAVTTLNKANVLAKTNVGSTVSVLDMFSNSIMTSSSALLDGANKAKLAADATRAIADAASNLNLPQIIAFSGAMDGMAGSMDNVMKKAMGMGREDVFAKALGTITAGAAPGEKEFVTTMAAMSLGIKDLNTATAIGAGESTRTRRQQGSSDQDARTRQDRLLNASIQSQAHLKQIAGFVLGDLVRRGLGGVGQGAPPRPTTVREQRSGMGRPGESVATR